MNECGLGVVFEWQMANGKWQIWDLETAICWETIKPPVAIRFNSVQMARVII
jgi:hypothetical protein